ncbi:pseudouridylate synthase [Moraxella sp. K127]|nr:pseudouridylate synthase [Moraxella sp. K127]
MLQTAPPMKDGVSPSRIYLEKLNNTPKNLLVFLCQKFPHVSFDEWWARFENGDVWSDTTEGGFVPLMSDAPYLHGRTIYYYRSLACEVVVPFDYQIIFENDEFMVVDKPHFLAVTPSGSYVKQTLLARLKADTGNADLSPIHRLDRETAGLILISRNVATRHRYQALFAHHAINKVYHAIATVNHNLTMPTDVRLHLERGEPFYVMCVNTDKPVNTHTHIDILAVKGDLAKYELRPTTGKLHQLRVHLNHLGTPICHDPYYPSVRHKPKDDFTSPLQLLAKHLVFDDPITGERREFTSRQELDL